MKPLGGKSYGSIPHLLGSKLGAGDHHCDPGQHKIATEKTRDKHDLVVVQEKYDGSNVGIAKINGQIIALTRSGYIAESSPYEQHHLFGKWVETNNIRFDALLAEGDRLCGEWLLQAHGLRYEIPNSAEPFVAFDYFFEKKRLCFQDFLEKLTPFDFKTPRILHTGAACSIETALERLFDQSNAEIRTISAQPEGLIYRIERKKVVDFLAKFVRNDFQPGIFLTEISGHPTVFNVEI
jgi:hypothetical protein